MNKPLTLTAATIAMTTMTLAASHAGPLSAGTSALKQSLATQAGQSQLVHKMGKKRKLVTGILLGLGAAAAISYSIRHERRCRRWYRKCWNGNERACWKYDTRCSY